ncbi:UDP-N-acetylmuramoylalanyl-D-glutamate--2, 6-diaminopimelate ligase MurE [Bifidobacterium actinocoloniiforme DSM 22766]|uniref:Lipid II isoglutaminyl synthase (glutamine-hydrolyzing) subunit MurT n=1 Tax=Bifidobacterium actinocoloniiforme DSM 22766 TaxID=1437605 RepID=A0A086Z2D4_9BIFI|nr:Mur ligase family protein [Bifidobacterium actinocoloniiforme]AKV55690.1 glutamate ligase [Bifidobacterium actinocoloniiforme DSM 22766]KFI40684.1 UDP-N-acetylmuramoylalanyl-D-glutamate--2, 6-diaminopimelate ligase MurE [Bifidobacterium actinocoloniiforme DSM 22766]
MASGETTRGGHPKQAAAPKPRRRPWYGFLALPAGKAARALSRLTHHGGSALPGKVVERLDPTFLARTLAQLPMGVVLVSGTNGKTTTTRMVASMLEELGLKVFTNPTGSNFTRGVVSALVTELGSGAGGGGLDADIAVLELDEAYAVHFVQQVRPRYALLLNVMRDQLDRFGEIDNTARLLGSVAKATSGTVVLNREDPRVAGLAGLTAATASVRYFGLADSLLSYFPSDDEMHDADLAGSGAGTDSTQALAARLAARPEHALAADVVLTAVGDHTASFQVDGQALSTQVKLEGVYNLYNAAAALALVRAVLSDRQATGGQPMPSDQRLMRALAQVTPAFGRGEVIEYQGAPIELVLVKNPMGFRLALSSFNPAGSDTMIAIRDEYADGRDMSWLWDVDFASLRPGGVAMVSGTRAWDMALRLDYDQVRVGAVEPDLEEALHRFAGAHAGTPKRVYCTYTAMLRLRAELGRMTQVADAGVGA